VARYSVRRGLKSFMYPRVRNVFPVVFSSSCAQPGLFRKAVKQLSRSDSPGARSRARDLIVQSLYQMQIAGHDVAELLRQFHDRPDYQRVDQSYFDEALQTICESRVSLEEDIDELADRPLSQLDPVERAILLLGLYELRSQPSVPYKVVINESVNLAKRFGAVDGHKYINALLDKAVRKLRPET